MSGGDSDPLIPPVSTPLPAPHKVDNTRLRSIRTSKMEKYVLHLLDERPGTSVQQLAAAAEGMSHPLVWAVLHEQLLYPCHLQHVQAVRPKDHLSR